MLNSINPLLDINTSFCDYLESRTRSFQDHVVGGTLDYAFDADFVSRQKIGGLSGWSRLYKAIVSSDIPARFKQLSETSEEAGSMNYSKAYEAAKKCSKRLQIGIPNILVRKTEGMPEIISLMGDGIDSTIVMTADIAEGCTEQELCYLIGCECGRLQNRHCAFNYAFTYPGISRGEDRDAGSDNVKGGIREISYNLNSWLILGDITADRAGIICLDDPADFPKIYASVREKGIPDSYGRVNKEIDLPEILKRSDAVHITPVRDLKIGDEYTADDRRIIAGIEFASCEILYIWRPDLTRPNSHMGNKQALEIRCDIIANSDANHSA